jgi:hypothetical protein
LTFFSDEGAITNYNNDVPQLLAKKCQIPLLLFKLANTSFNHYTGIMSFCRQNDYPFEIGHAIMADEPGFFEMAHIL